jgi:hypothetical protein
MKTLIPLAQFQDNLLLQIKPSHWVNVHLYLISNGDQIRSFLYERIQFSRNKEGVREMDIFR